MSNLTIVTRRIVACRSPKRLEFTRFAIFSALYITVLAGCATTVVSNDLRMRESVAQDFAISLATLSDTRTTSLSMQAPLQSRGFAAALQKALREEGFVVAENYSEDALPVTYNIESVTHEKGSSERYALTVGPLVIMREYQRHNDDVYPVSAFEIDNTLDPVGIDSTADAVVAEAPTQPQPQPQPKAQAQAPSDPFAELVDSAAAIETAMVSPLPEPEPVSPGLPHDIESVERKNMYKTRVSAFGEFTQGYESIEKEVLIFPNDSLHITDDAGSTLEALSGQFRADSDVFSVIGCSHGKTELENGNALLAVGRSKRVKQFLIEQGVPVNRILDEGCWAPVHFDEVMPRRGVLVELKRDTA